MLWPAIYTPNATDERHRPSAPCSWCGWQKEKAGGKPNIPEYPPWHHPWRHIWGCQTNLCSTDQEVTLQKCLTGATQNAHESFRGIAWQHCPKEQNVGKEVVDISTNIAVFLINHGHTVAHLCAWRKWLHCRKGAAEGGSRPSWFTTSSVKAQIHTKEARKKGRSTRKGYEKEVKDAEGPTYKAGGV